MNVISLFSGCGGLDIGKDENSFTVCGSRRIRPGF